MNITSHIRMPGRKIRHNTIVEGLREILLNGKGNDNQKTQKFFKRF
jgi:hypothetical protein